MHSDLIITYSLVLLQSSEIVIRLGPKPNLDWDQHLSLTIDCQIFTITVDISLLLITTLQCTDCIQEIISSKYLFLGQKVTPNNV